MRIALISDIHGNIDALDTVLAHIGEQQVDEIACLGDIVGYGGAPKLCCQKVRQHCTRTVLGNHDAAVAGLASYDFYHSAAREALDYHRELLDDEDLDWLKSLPYRIREPGLQLTHGRPDVRDDFAYMFDDQHAIALLQAYDQLEAVNFIGHSHLTAVYRLNPHESPGYERADALHIDLRSDSKYVITVGSVGQPRDNDARACYVIYDDHAYTVDFFRLDYNVRAAALRIWEQDRLAATFAKRLYLGV